MPTVRYLKAFRGKPKYNNPSELDHAAGVSKIKAKSFPHTEKNLWVIGLVGVEPGFYGQFILRMPDTPNDYYEITVQNPDPDLIWAVIEQAAHSVTFTEPTDYAIELLLDGVVFHTLHIPVTRLGVSST